MEALNSFFEHLEKSLQSGYFQKITLGKSTGHIAELNNIYVKLISIKNSPHLSFTYRYQTKDVVKNHLIADSIIELKKLIGENFLHAHLFTSAANFQLTINKKGKASLVQSDSVNMIKITSGHDHEKKRSISTINNQYLQALKVVNNEGHILSGMQDKYKQINKYIEIVENLIIQTNLQSPIRIADMGSGKGYLTFALYDHLVNNLGMEVFITGIEQRQELVELCNRIAETCQFKNLLFTAGKIGDGSIDKIDVLIALHACDTATDDAIYQGISSQAKLIICAPCCHKQIRKQINDKGQFKQVLKHGILKEREAEIITDTIRALLLESKGYRSSVFEFISTEHTGKNLMISGVKVKQNINEQSILQEVAQLKSAFGIDKHYLESLLEKN